MTIGTRCRGLVLMAPLLLLLSAGGARAARIIATPFAELTPPGEYRLWAFAIQEDRAGDDLRFLYRLDVGLTRRFEFGTLVIDPEHARSSTWLHLQGLLVRKHEGMPTISVGLWDAANLGGFSGRTTGGSFFANAVKTVPLGAPGSLGPLKLSLGVGTNRLEGLFGGAVLALSKRTGVQAEFVPRNLRLSGADNVNAGIYHFVAPNVRARASWTGGNPMVDVFFSGKIP